LTIAFANHARLPAAIEDYALIGDCTTAALVSRDGSIDWLCWPRFDSDACFAALLGTTRNGHWRIGPADPDARITRRYRPGTMILETRFETNSGSVVLVDFMPVGEPNSAVIRIVQGERGQLAMRLDLALRFEYGRTVPWVTRLEHRTGLTAIAGPDMVVLHSSVPLHGQALTSVAEFTVGAGDSKAFVLNFAPSHLPRPAPIDAATALAATERYWTEWNARGTYRGAWPDPVSRSLLTLKALTYAPTGGIVAAPTTSLPEQLGGERNWDYRYCWLRDSTFTLLALLHAGYQEEAAAFREWLLRAVAGSRAQIQIMYGLAGERRLPEWEVPWLPGYHGARPVRVGNGAAGQLQLDVYGELMDAAYQASRAGLPRLPKEWRLRRLLLRHMEMIWREPDEGIWEVRGGRRHFTFSKVMAWVALDRAVRTVEEFAADGPADRWRELRRQVHESICREGFDTSKNSFVQSYGDTALDASLLMIPLVGFLPPEDPRVKGTLAAIERELMQDGLVMRYRTEGAIDGLPPGEGMFLACSFWFADNLVLQGRLAEARTMFEHLLSLRNDVGLLAEEYDPRARRQLGNFPQAFSHLALVNTAFNLTRDGPAQQRSGD
jgi:GH15 family glucan-1,4-alpha-glucosidase